MHKRSWGLLLLVSLFFLFSCRSNEEALNTGQSTSSDEKGEDSSFEYDPYDSDPEHALEDYLNNEDPFDWELKEQEEAGNTKLYHLLLTSQTWQDFKWQHQLSLILPEGNPTDKMLLFIGGGSNKTDGDGSPNWDSDNSEVEMMKMIANAMKAPIAVLKQVPNQPYFNGLKEDELISFTLHQYQETGDYSWPLLFPMTKSVVKAMDAVQEFMEEKYEREISSFIVSGASKRGWTTWLSGAADQRVAAIAPLVIDILNMPATLSHQLEAYGTYSEQIKDYEALGILDEINEDGSTTTGGSELVQMIDPYSYKEKLTMPKLLGMGTNDPYWVIDNVQFYLPDLPGENMIHYVPNAGHDMNISGNLSIVYAIKGFYNSILHGASLPIIKWETRTEDNKIKLDLLPEKTDFTKVTLWSARSSDRDFRDETWTSREINIPEKDQFTVKEEFPEEGYSAFYVDLTYKDYDGLEYTISTRAFVTDTEKIL